jgi:endogenous inhibitor of DNA gyrase (YacG/DUF329 family)
LIDLGAWLSEQRAIPGDNSPSPGDEAPPAEEDHQ